MNDEFDNIIFKSQMRRDFEEFSKLTPEQRKEKLKEAEDSKIKNPLSRYCKPDEMIVYYKGTWKIIKKKVYYRQFACLLRIQRNGSLSTGQIQSAETYKSLMLKQINKYR